MHTSLGYTCLSIQPADKTAEHLIDSYKQLILEKKTEAISVYVINSNGEGQKEGNKSRRKKGGEKKEDRFTLISIERERET